MGVPAAFAAGLIVAVPILIILIVWITIWRCSVVAKRTKGRAEILRAPELRPALPQVAQFTEHQSSESSQLSNSTLEFLQVQNSEVSVSASFTMAKDYDRNILQSYRTPANIGNDIADEHVHGYQCSDTSI